jgi:hypothetical protein
VSKEIHRWEGNLVVHLEKFGCEEVERIRLAQDGVQHPALVSTVMDLGVPEGRWTYCRLLGSQEWF